MNRRTFFKIFASISGIGSIIALGLVIEENKNTRGKEKTIINIKSLHSGINFFNDYIIVKHDNLIRILSSKCSHLGCKISFEKNGLLVCPCHGSEFDQNGSVTKGPAVENLKNIKYSIKNEELIIL